MPSRISHEEALRRVPVLSVLSAFDPHVAGTPPLGIDLADSDIDILCNAPDADGFTAVLWNSFSGHDGFSVRQWSGAEHPIIATFHAEGWAFEIFGHAQPVRHQAGWRHFVVERRLPALGGTSFREAVMALRDQGLKTEPAFAKLLALTGDPYEALLDLENWSDARLAAAINPAPASQ